MSTDYFFPFFLLFLAFGLFVWLLGAAVFYRSLTIESLFRAPWLGCALLVGLLQLGHLFFRISKGFSIGVLTVTGAMAISALSLTFRAGWIRRNYALAGTFASLATFALLAAVASLLAFLPTFNACTKEMCHYDLGLYYLKAIRWTESFPIVPGLVNVQEHLGFNQSAFLLISFLDSLVPNRWGIFLIGGVLPWMGLSLSLIAIGRIALLCFRKIEHVHPITVAYAISLPAWIFTLAAGNISSATPDCISWCLSIHLFLVFACFIVSSEEDEWKRSFGEILVLGALCLCVKLNSLGLVAGTWTVAAVLLARRLGLAGFLRKHVLIGAGLLMVFLSTWLWRGVVLSGYPLFPSTALAMPVKWRMPRRDVQLFYGLTIWWARDPNPERSMKTALKTWKWLPYWWKRILPAMTQFAWPLQVGVAGSASLVLTAAVGGGTMRKHVSDLALTAAPIFFNSAFWFLTAPEPRYFGPCVWLFAICPALTFVDGGPRLGALVSAANLVSCAVPLCFLAWEFKWNWSYPEPRLPNFKTVELRESVSDSGVAVWFPAEGDRTFDGPIPSSRSPRPNLAYLDPRKGVSGGFRYLKVQNSSSP